MEQLLSAQDDPGAVRGIREYPDCAPSSLPPTAARLASTKMGPSGHSLIGRFCGNEGRKCDTRLVPVRLGSLHREAGGPIAESHSNLFIESIGSLCWGSFDDCFVERPG